ncbi:hypothetical protein D0T49_10505 [Paludibacter sp. 221]|uniref:HU domain-containing protein n=1 Tax=Paludibacter sp. 221 TaxID=2302939 RepID=UPI0013D3A802|nr:hypothetical protein [Paludibacter sp. 221]NDV47477.1 hypothetical protein [Paludibacter sp. 221]
MEKIIRHIELLLIKNDFVIIPDFGGFVIQTQSAKVTDNGIIPPCSIVGFNPRMNNNDGLLATEVSKSENISYSEACRFIETETDKFQSGLRKGEKMVFGKLGSFSLNKENAIIFAAAQKNDFIPANFGLKEINTPKLKRNKTVTLSVPPVKNVFRYAAAILILFTVLFISPRIGNNDISQHAGIQNPFAALNTPKDKSNIEEQSINVDTGELKKYHVVVSGFSEMKPAELYRDLLHAKYYDNAFVLPLANLNHVIIESFSSKEIAILYLKKIREQSKDFQNAWLYQEVAE